MWKVSGNRNASGRSPKVSSPVNPPPSLHTQAWVCEVVWYTDTGGNQPQTDQVYSFSVCSGVGEGSGGVGVLQGWGRGIPSSPTRARKGMVMNHGR